jgi:aldehyde dehydrogenase (NAD+)
MDMDAGATRSPFHRNGPLIGDRWLTAASGGVAQHINPSTGAPQAEVVIGAAAEIDAAVAAARPAQREWIRRAPDQRRDTLLALAALVEAHRPEFALLAALESGMPIAGSGGMDLALAWIRYYAGWADKVGGSTFDGYPARGLGFTKPEPYGIIGAIIPWNAPLIAVSMKVVPALAAGNAVILKPPSLTPFAALRFGELALEAGLPPGLLSVVPGDAEAGEALVRHPDVGKVSFTGGEAIARRVIAASAETLKPLALELGGKSANIIFADADLEAAVPMAVAMGCVQLSGQGCVLPTRLLVHDSVYDEVVARAGAVAGAFRIGPAIDPETRMGPVISAAACERILGVIDRAKAEGQGRLVCGGKRAGGDLAAGYFIPATVFADVAPDAGIARGEIFGPVLSILRFSDEDEAVRMANDTDYGLGAYLHTRDLDRALKVSSQLEAGYVSVNGFAGMTPNAPFGGYKRSGYGREGGHQGLEEFLQTKTVWMRQAPV